MTTVFSLVLVTAALAFGQSPLPPDLEKFGTTSLLTKQPLPLFSAK
jgi:hypothetical protein